MRIASIDIGTNTILLLVADVVDGALLVVEDLQAFARLGKGIDAGRMIQRDAFDRCEEILRKHIRRARELHADRIVATGTSALRDAENREDFLHSMSDELGLHIEIISGDEEARWSYLGSISGIQHRDRQFAVLDIGGGSTELIVGDGARILERKSVNVGSVRMTEQFLSTIPPSTTQLSNLYMYLEEKLAPLPSISSQYTFIGVAGSVTTLAALDLHLERFDGEKISGYTMSREAVEGWFNILSMCDEVQLRNELRIDPGRSDIIVAGVAILLTIMRMNGIERITVSERGLRYGIALREAGVLSF